MSLFLAILPVVALAILFGVLLGFAAIKFKIDGDPVIDQIEDILPQTQCGQCGYPGCRPYAEAIAQGEAINKCPPGGVQGIKELANLLGREVIELDDEVEEQEQPTIVYIREADCIGCTKCIQACPVDAIVGAAKLMHTIIMDECTGCDLCIPPCPVDCIDIHNIPITPANWTAPPPTLLIPVKEI
jgi:electron transport complex protein RnfB